MLVTPQAAAEGEGLPTVRLASWSAPKGVWLAWKIKRREQDHFMCEISFLLFRKRGNVPTSHKASQTWPHNVWTGMGVLGKAHRVAPYPAQIMGGRPTKVSYLCPWSSWPKQCECTEILLYISADNSFKHLYCLYSLRGFSRESSVIFLKDQYCSCKTWKKM